jgi:hypothetical protein
MALNAAGPSIKYVTAFPLRSVAFDEIAPETMLDQRVGSGVPLALVDELLVDPFCCVESLLEEADGAPPGGSPPSSWALSLDDVSWFMQKETP